MANNKKKTAGRKGSNLTGTISKSHAKKVVDGIVNADCLTTLRKYAATADKYKPLGQIYLEKFYQLGNEFAGLVEECTNLEELDFLVSEMATFDCAKQEFECKVIENHRKFLESRVEPLITESNE